MKIAMIGSKGIPAASGGVERHVEELSTELVKLGHDVLVYSRAWYTGVNKPRFSHRGVTCVSVPSLRTKHFDSITHTFASIVAAAREGVDVFHIHGVGPALLSWLPKLLLPSAKVVVTFHCIDRHHEKWGWIARFMLRTGEWAAVRFPDATIAVAKSLQDYLRLTYATHTMHVPNGTRMPEGEGDATKLSKFGLEKGKYLMFCARLVRHKGAHVLVEAWKLLCKERPDLTDGMKLAIVGGSAFTDGYVRELTELAKGDESIVLTGAQHGEDLHALFSHAYAFAHPSSSEGLPISVLEAMSYGKCVVAADIPESREVVEGHGLTFKVGNVEDLARKLAMVIESPDLAASVGYDARDFVARQYDWDNIAETTSYLYEALQFEPRVQVRPVAGR